MHFACTSEDINNLAYALMLHDARDKVLMPTLDKPSRPCATMAHALADAADAVAHARPDRLADDPGQGNRQRRRPPGAPTRPDWPDWILPGKINGAVGNYNAHVVAYPEVDWPALAQHFVESLGLDWNPYTTQIEPHDGIAELCDAIRRVNTILIDLCRDIWGYISLGYFRQALKPGEVGSSTMPHKVNPIDFENAEGNLGIANALFDALRRKAADLALAARPDRLDRAARTRHRLRPHPGRTRIAAARPGQARARTPSAWPPISTRTGRFWPRRSRPSCAATALPDPYEQLKALTRGKGIDRDTLREFVDALDLPQDAKARLLDLTPASYTGLAAKLARDI